MDIHSENISYLWKMSKFLFAFYFFLLQNILKISVIYIAILELLCKQQAKIFQVAMYVFRLL